MFFHIDRRFCACVLSGFFAAVSTVHAGDLTPPPGPIGPTMKPLSQVEPRVNVNSLAGSALAKHVISAPGSYYLTEDVISTLPGESGILIASSGVTLDLMGFNVVGAGGAAGAGIRAQGAIAGVTVRNGSLYGWGDYGVDASSAQQVILQQLQAADNVKGGLHVGTSAQVSQCVAWGNATGAGIRCSGSRAYLDGNLLIDNGTGVLVTGTHNFLVRNIAQNNASADFDIAPQNSYGQIQYGAGADFVVTNAWANFAGCPTGESICNGQCINFQTNLNHCGGCNSPCVPPPNATATCVNGECQFFCIPGFSDCNSDFGDGCETDTRSDPGNCGGCNVVCTAMPSSTCGTTGGCVNGVCQLFPAGTPCAPGHCTGNTFNPPDFCDGNGGCTNTPPVFCGGFNCNGSTGCLTSCSGNSQCISSHYCASGICVPKKPSGADCDSGAECISGTCLFGHCQ